MLLLLRTRSVLSVIQRVEHVLGDLKRNVSLTRVNQDYCMTHQLSYAQLLALMDITATTPTALNHVKTWEIVRSATLNAILATIPL